MRRFNNMLIAVALCFVLSSCGLYTKYSRPEGVENSVEKLYRGVAAEAADSVANFGTKPWQEVFTDPALQRLIDSALVRNTDVRVSQLRVGEAEAALKAARLAYIPSFAFTPNGAAASFGFSKEQWSYSVPITASWQLDIFGRLTAAKRRAKAAVEGSEAYSRAVRSQVVGAMANMYYMLLMLDAQLSIAEQTSESWGKNVETMRLMKEAGMSNEASVRQMEANYYAICTMVHDLREQVFLLENFISIMLADVPQRIERTTLAEQSLPTEVYTGVPLHLLSQRPDVQIAEQNLVQAFYATNEARASLYPSITLSGSGGWTNAVGAAIVNPASLLWSVAASLFQPIFQNGALRARLKIAKLQQQEAELQFRQTLLNAGNEVNTAIEQCQTSRTKHTLYEQQVESLAAAVESTQLMMEHGSSTYLEVLVAQQTLLNAQLSLTENRFKELQGMVNLYVALGGK